MVAYLLIHVGKQFLDITEQEEAERKIRELSERLAERMASETEEVRIEEARGRIASTDIFSPLDIPPFDRATMDGYAVVASDTYYASEDNPSMLVVKARIQAGDAPSIGVTRGFCAGITTGAPIPEGADAVVKIENTTEHDDNVKIYKPVAPGENIMPAGSDIKRGEKIVKRGSMLTMRDTGVMAACGMTRLEVRKKPRVAIISTGNELLMPGEDLTPGKIYDVNVRTLSDCVRACGSVPVSLGIARDRRIEIENKIVEGLKMDAVLISGGTSAGGGDEVPGAIADLGEIILHGVDIKPGKPFVLGICDDKPVFGLPGNPTSALITFNLFVAPLLRRISGLETRKTGDSQRRIARAACRIFSEAGRNEYVMVRLVAGDDGLLAYPILSGSGAITTLAKADGYIYVEKGREIIEEGAVVEVVPLP